MNFNMFLSPAKNDTPDHKNLSTFLHRKRPNQPLPKCIHQVKNSWVHLPKIEGFYQQFMGSFFASSVETVFHENDLRGVHTVIDVGIA